MPPRHRFFIFIKQVKELVCTLIFRCTRNSYQCSQCHPFGDNCHSIFIKQCFIASNHGGKIYFGRILYIRHPSLITSFAYSSNRTVERLISSPSVFPILLCERTPSGQSSWVFPEFGYYPLREHVFSGSWRVATEDTALCHMLFKLFYEGVSTTMEITNLLPRYDRCTQFLCYPLKYGDHRCLLYSETGKA